MKQHALTLVLLIFVCCIQAQSEDLVRHSLIGEWYAEEHNNAYLLADEVSLRTCDSSGCGLITTLAIGTPLRMIEEGKKMTLNSVASYWYKVRAGEYTGWLWGGFIATMHSGSHSDPTVKFVGGFEKSVEQDGWYQKVYQIRAFRDGEELSKLSVPCFGHYFGEFRNFGDLGVEGVHDIIQLHVPCTGGCGCTTGDAYVFWNGEELIHVADIGGSADGEYSEGQSFIFPCDMEGEAPYIIKYSDFVRWEALDEMEGEINEVPRIFKYEYFIWNGKRLVAAQNKSTREYKLN